jgi:diguanylate cyclase (GGDEF)-like protein
VTVEFLGPLVLARARTRRALDVLWALPAVAGVVLLELDDGGAAPLGGLLLALTAGLCWAAYIVLSARLGRVVPGTTAFVGGESSGGRPGCRTTGVTQREAAMSARLRDRHAASRAVAYLMLAGSPFLFVTGVLQNLHQPLASMIAIIVTSVVVAVGGWVCWSRPHVMPDAFWLAAPVIATTLITGMNWITNDSSTGAQLFYLWPVLYAANFMTRSAIYVNLLIVFAGDGAVAFRVMEQKYAWPNVASMALAVTMTVVVVVSLRDRGDKLLHELEAQAKADSLTGLANRRSFDAALSRAVTWALRNDGEIALITVDVDHFKSINDTWGHAVGDQALKAVARAMDEVAVGEDDLAARLGGDEFVMLLRRDTDGALRAAEELRRAIAAIDELPGEAPGVSLGVAVLPDDAVTVETLLAASDAALYQAKTSGRGRVAAASSGRHNVDRMPADTETAVRR